MKIKNEAGEEIEVFSQEEADALVKQRAEEAAETARKEALEAAEAEKAELEEKLKKYENKDYNFNQLRNKKEKEDSAAAAEAKKLAEQLAEVNARLGKVESQPFEKAKNEFIAANNIAGDKELNEKFDFFFEPLASKAKTEADYKAALAGAFAAATGGTKQPTFDGMMVSTRVTPPTSGGDSQSEASKTFSSAFGLSEKDHKKYGKKSN